MSKVNWRVPGRLAAVAGRLGLAIGVALFIAGSPTIVGAAAAPRISGPFSTTLTVTAQKNSYNTVGQQITRNWTFTPQCANGGCATKLSRIRGDNTISKYTLNPVLKNGKWQYTTTANQTTNCYAPGGALVKKNAYDSTEKIVLKVGNVTGGNVTSFTGSYALTFKATSAAKALGCKDGFVKGTFKNS